MSWMVVTRVSDYSFIVLDVTCSPHVDTKVFDIVEELAKRICNLHPACVLGKFSKLQCQIRDACTLIVFL